jgi:Xaa-Pro aminopeptidase
MPQPTPQPVDPYAVDLMACRGRQRRLLDELAELNVDTAVVSRRETVQWLTGVLVRPPFEPIAALTSDGQLTLVTPEGQLNDSAAADIRIGYESNLYSTMRDDQRAASCEALQASWTRSPRGAACEFSAFCPQLCLQWNVPLVDLDAVMFALRRHKDADELRMLRRANQANQAMYEHARTIVRPGVDEIDVYNELHRVAVQTLGEPLTYFGQDFRCNARGGSPRHRAAQAGELYILDLGVGFRGYYSDNARTIAVDAEPTDAQRAAWRAVMEVFPLIVDSVRPGVRCREVFAKAEKLLAKSKPLVFDHHLGHGVGLAPHEGPHLNPRWDDTFAEGDFIAVEPGLYHEDLRQGIRLEQNYLVTATGVELLTDWALEL